MGVVAVSDIRIAPIGEDLTTPDLSLQVLRGLETMHRADKPVATGVSLVKGEWGVLGSDGKLTRAGAVPVGQTYLVFSGTDRFDSHATKQVTIIENSAIVVKTSKYDVGQSYAIGDYLTVKDLGHGESYVTKRSGTEPRLARVTEVGVGYLVFDVLNGL